MHTSTPCNPIKISAIAFVLANLEIAASGNACRRRPSCIGVQRTGGGGKKENLMPSYLHGYQSSLSAADSRVHWLSQPASFADELQAIATSRCVRMRKMSVRSNADRPNARIATLEMAHTWCVHCVMEILKAEHLVITREPARRIVSAFMHPAAGQLVPALRHSMPYSCI